MGWPEPSQRSAVNDWGGGPAPTPTACARGALGGNQGVAVQAQALENSGLLACSFLSLVS